METTLSNKLKLLTVTSKDLDAVIHRRRERELNRKMKDIEKILDGVYAAKLAVLEEKIAAAEAPETIDDWSSSIDTSIAPFEDFMEKLAETVNDIHREEEEVKTQKQKKEAEEQAAKEYQEQKRIETMKLQLKKESDKGAAKDSTTRAKLPKLEISKFKGS